jgi:hypothetical protein
MRADEAMREGFLMIEEWLDMLVAYQRRVRACVPRMPSFGRSTSE